jgi:pimeloyl-ACP methyl ester carboxylesterase
MNSASARETLGPMIRLTVALTALLAMVPLGGASPAGLPLEPCTLTGGVEARCGTFTVPEDRGQTGGRTISLRVAVLPARDGGTKRDPLVYIVGGPGGSAVAEARALLTTFSEALESRDIVLVDQRGTGGSNRLVCPTPAARPRNAADVRAYFSACMASLDADPRQYTTVPAMEDLADVLGALGYRQVNLYGGSYGATAAQYFLAQHPELVRTVILDGGTLLDVPIFELWGRNGQKALKSTLGRCAGIRSCRAHYPRVRREVFEMIAALRRKPVRARGTVIDAAKAADAVQSLSRSPNGAARIPWLAHRARRGDWAPFARVVRQEAATVPVSVMYWSIVCNEYWARRDPQRTAAASRGTYLTDVTGRQARFVAAACSAVPKSAQPSWSKARVRSDKPVLLVVGGADPQDPLSNVAQAQRELPNSRTVVVPAGGHGSIQLGCTSRVAQRFIDTGTVAGLDARCVSRYRPPPFVHR